MMMTNEMTECMCDDDRKTIDQPHTLTLTHITDHRHPKHYITKVVVPFQFWLGQHFWNQILDKEMQSLLKKYTLASQARARK